MKKLFLSLVAMMAATATFAQSSMLATLSHEGEISTYYGATALRDAYNAATHGDIITLSSGSFSAVNIEKALTIRGAGMQVDSVSKTYPTNIAGNFTINIADSIEQRLTMEGLYSNFTITVKGTLKNASFLKDRLGSILPENSSTGMRNLMFVHCRISSSIFLPANSSASFVNCYVSNAVSMNSTSSNFEFTNCIIKNNGNNYYSVGGSSKYCYLSSITCSTFNNCIIYAASNNGSIYEVINSSCTAYYCVGKSDYNIFGNIPNTTNTRISVFSTLFKTYTGSYNDTETFELTEEAKTKYKGGEGTEVGIYGGNLPYNPTPSNPQITKCNVASKSTADGKLSVDIEVSAAE